MIPYLNINPIAFKVGPLKVYWYGLMYLFSFAIGWLLIKYRAKKFNTGWTSTQISDLVFFIAVGVIAGARIGYMLFYNLPNFIHAPWIILKIWDGGMSFHGGLLGVIFMLWWWSKRNNESVFTMTDFLAPIVPIGLAAGRLGNFINGYLFGRVTDMPWAMVFPAGGPLPRHPSPIYEFLLEGVFLFIILWTYSARQRPRMAVSGLFLLGYGCLRWVCEFFRQPDPQLGFIAGGWLTMGQLLSVPMIVGGIFVLWFAYRRVKKKRGE